jgi:hypothetical protein
MAAGTERNETQAGTTAVWEAPGEQQQGDEHAGVAVAGPLQALTRSKREGALGPARRRYTLLHGRLLSLTRLSTARKMVEFLRALGIEGASVLEVGGGVGEV